MKPILALTITTAAIAISGAAFAQTTVSKSTTTSADGSTITTITRTTDTDTRASTITTPQQFSSYAYSRWDKNADGFITPDEWDYNVVRWYGPNVTTYKTYSDWDLNRNGQLDAGEFGTVVTKTGLYDTWNVTTTTVPATTTPDASFATYDLNGDGNITPSEWTQIHKK